MGKFKKLKKLVYGTIDLYNEEKQQLLDEIDCLKKCHEEEHLQLTEEIESLKNKIKSLKKDVKRLDDDDFDLQNQIDELEETAYGFIDLDNRDEEDLAYADEIAEKVELECECECKCGCHEDSDTVIDILKKKVKNLKEDVKRLDDDDFDMQNQIDSLEVVTYGYVALDDRDEEDKEYAKEILEKIELACGECCEEECSDEMSEEIIDEEEKTNYSCGCSNQVEIDEPTEKKEEENDTPWYKNE